MFIILLLLLSIFFFPVLLVPFGLFFLFLIIFIPFKFTLDSVLNLITVPSQIYRIATNPVLRKNHGLEHATVNVLEREYGLKNLSGFARDKGFYIMGTNSVRAVEEAARKGLSLMKNGRSELAIHSKCGTSITVANFVSAVIFLALLLSTGHFSFLFMIIAIIAANLTGPYLGELVQKYFTTSSDVEEMEIISAGFTRGGFWNQQQKILVRTEQIPYLK